MAKLSRYEKRQMQKSWVRHQREEERSQHKLRISSAKKELRDFKASNKADNKPLTKTLGIFGAIIPLLLVVVLARTFMNEDYSFSFIGFLQELSSIPLFDPRVFNELLNAFVITSDWSVFNWLRDFFNVFGQLLGFLQFIGFMLFNALSYMWSFVRLLFGI